VVVARTTVMVGNLVQWSSAEIHVARRRRPMEPIRRSFFIEEKPTADESTK